MTTFPTIEPTAAQLALGPGISYAVRFLVALDVPDMLVGGPRSVADLAADTSAAPVRLRQALRLAATTELFHRDGADTYSLTDEGRVLTRDHPSSARDFLLFFEGPLVLGAMSATVEAARSGLTAIEQFSGRPTFEALAADPPTAVSFNRMMVAAHGREPEAIVRAYDLPRSGLVVDCGGGLGGLLRAVLDARPQLSGILFDRPSVIDEARAGIETAPAAGRVELVAGDFFESVPDGGDVLLLSHILHDWDDERATEILRRCRDAMTSTSRLLVVEGILDETEELDALKLLNFLIGFCAGGAERTEAEYADLLTAAGLMLSRVVPTDSPTVSVIEAVRVD